MAMTEDIVVAVVSLLLLVFGKEHQFLFVFAFIAQKIYRMGPILIILLCGCAGIILGL